MSIDLYEVRPRKDHRGVVLTLFLKGEYALDRAWKSSGFPLLYFLSRMGDPMSSGGFLKK